MSETERAALIAGQWASADYARLHAGELTPNEIRLVAAVARAIAAEIRRMEGEKCRNTTSQP